MALDLKSFFKIKCNQHSQKRNMNMNLSFLASLFAFVEACARVQGGKNGTSDAAHPAVSAAFFSITADSNAMLILLMESLKQVAAKASKANTTAAEQPNSVEVPSFVDNNKNQGPIFGAWAQEEISCSGSCDLVLLQQPWHGHPHSNSKNQSTMDPLVQCSCSNRQRNTWSNGRQRRKKSTLDQWCEGWDT